MHLGHFASMLLALILVPASAAEPQVLPPPECVRLLREARGLVAFAKPAEAEKKLEEAVTACPGDPIAVFALLELHRDQGADPARSAELVARLKQLLRAEDTVVASAAFRKLAEDPGLDANGLSILREAIETRLARSPEAADLLRSLAAVQARTEDLEGASATLHRLLTIREDPQSLRACAEIDLALGRWDDAVPLLRKVRERQGDQPFLRLQLARALAAAGRGEEAGKELEPLLAQRSLAPPVVREVLLQVAWSLRDAGRDAEAEPYFRKVLERDPENQPARSAILHLYATPDERDAVAKASAEAWQNEQDPVRLVNEGASRLAGGDAAAALPFLRRATEIDATSEAAWFNRGLAAMKVEGWQEAADSMRKVLELRSDSTQARLNLGIALARLGDLQQAIVELEKVVAVEPAQALAHDYLRFCYERTGKPAEAEKHRKLAGSGGS
jgi:tetratricopeptide (TPR) repeat protein